MHFVPVFQKTLENHGIELVRLGSKVVQVNLGKFCNQACHHCHVEAGPKRTERMSRPTTERIVSLLERSSCVRTVDITGGAPELNDNFRYLVHAARELGHEVIDRCNLTVLFEKGQEDLAQFLGDERVTIIASLPCYSKDNVDKQRGSGVFDKSIAALQELNRLGFGKADSGLELGLVYNPLGAFLPSDQSKLESAYRRELFELFGIEFSRLFTITNMPIKRFLHQLERDGKYDEYMALLVDSFNPVAAAGVMCRDLLSLDWQGNLFDCDFNQMLDMPVLGTTRNIWDIESFDDFQGGAIATGSHCYACTAGAGSSCGGALV